MVFERVWIEGFLYRYSRLLRGISEGGFFDINLNVTLKITRNGLPCFLCFVSLRGLYIFFIICVVIEARGGCKWEEISILYWRMTRGWKNRHNGLSEEKFYASKECQDLFQPLCFQIPCTIHCHLDSVRLTLLMSKLISTPTVRRSLFICSFDVHLF